MRHIPDAIVCLAVLAWGMSAALGANDLVGGDEGYYVTMARNLLADSAQWAIVSLSPLGPAGDKPPLVPALLAGVGAMCGFTAGALRWVPLISTAFAMLAAVRLARRAAGESAALATALLLATLPWLADSARVIAAEPTLAALGLWALVLLTDPAASPRRACVAGVLLGLAFLCKWWLVVLLAIPAAAALGARPWRLAAATAAGAVAAASLHVLMVLGLSPHDLAHWWNVLTGFSMASRLTGGGFADYWLQPPDFYLRLLGRALLLLSPSLALGVAAAWRQREQPVARALLATFGSLALLSAFRVKSGVYVLPLVPLLAALAGAGVGRLVARGPRLAPIAAWAMVALAAGVGGVRIAQRLPQRYHEPGYAAVAAYLGPRLAYASPRDTVLIAPEAPAFQALLFRTVDYWDTPYRAWTPERAAALRAGDGPRWWVIDPARQLYGGAPDEATIDWLERATREVTAEIEAAAGRSLSVRVFTVEPAPPR